jgi:hypothetical protein
MKTICTRKLCLVPLTLLLFALAAQAASPPERDEYAWGFPLSIAGEEGFYRARVPLSVYRSVTDARLRDSGVYNASGQAVPRIFELPETADEEILKRVPLPFIPRFRGQVENPDDLRLRLHREAGTTVLELDSTAPPVAGNGEPVLSSYIIDTRELEQPVRALEFNWDETAEGFIGRIRVEASNDLQSWRQIGQSTLARLSYDEARIEQADTPLRAGKYDYLRLSWQDFPADWRLNRIEAVLGDEPLAVEREWLELDAISNDPETAEWVFNAGGYPPVDRVTLVLPPENVLVRASIFHRSAPDANWRRVNNSVFYHLVRPDGSLQPPPASIGMVRSGEWKVRIESGSVAGPVGLKLGWVPDQLSFVAQGDGPWELVAGRALDSNEQFPQLTMMGDPAIFTLLAKSGDAGIAAVGERRVIGGEAQLSVADPPPWRKFGLWAGLLIAIGLVGWLVLSLMRDLRRQDEDTG